MPYYLSSDPYAFFLENTEYSVFDLTGDDLTSVRCYDDRMVGRICYGAEPLDRIEQFTEYTGRMDALPRWFHEGAIVGLQGGTEMVQEVYGELEKRDTPISAFWLQDWVGQRDTNIGKQLWWNWELDRSQYPDWEELVADLGEDGVEVLGYLNPYLADASERDDYDYERNFYQEAIDNDYFVTDPEGELIEITITDFAVGIVDITDPEAREWFKTEIVEKQVLGNGFRGWMADFGEALPFDSLLDSGALGDSYHNQYPVDYAGLNREALDESDEDDGVFFTRSGYTGSQGESTCFWLGDQMVTWDEDDGFESMIRGLVSSGLSGISLNHSDIGGYTSFQFFGLGFSRSRRLLERWTQTNAFTPVFRTHEGNQPDVNAQIYDDEGLYDHFSRFAKVFAALADYREQLMAEAESKGYPLVRHPMLEFPEDETAAGLNDQFMLGSEFMIAPVVDKHADSRELYLPAGEWIHVWTGERYGDAEDGTHVTVDAPVGEPAVFYRAGSEVGEQFVATLEEQGVREA
jgi:alpha-glucosidase